MVVPGTLESMGTTTEELVVALATYLGVNVSSVQVLTVTERTEPEEIAVSVVVEVPVSIAKEAEEALKSGAWLPAGSPPVEVEVAEIVCPDGSVAAEGDTPCVEPTV
eukprot:1501069-Rhodomonas_salina.1